MLRKAGMTEANFRYYENSEIRDWPTLLATLSMLTNEDIEVQATIQASSTMSSRN